MTENEKLAKKAFIAGWNQRDCASFEKPEDDIMKYAKDVDALNEFVKQNKT